MKRFDPQFKGIQLTEEEKKYLVNILLMLVDSIKKLPERIYLRRFYKGKSRKIWFYFSHCKYSLNSPMLSIQPIYICDKKAHEEALKDSLLVKEYKRNKRKNRNVSFETI